MNTENRLKQLEKKNYMLWQKVPDGKDSAVCPHYGFKEDAFRIFDGQMFGWKTRNDFYVTENNDRIPKT